MVLPRIQSLRTTPGTRSALYRLQHPGCSPVPRLTEGELQLDPWTVEEEVPEEALCAVRVKHLDTGVEPIPGKSIRWPGLNDVFPCFSFLPEKETECSRIGSLG